MRLTPNDIVEALVDELVTGELGEQHDSLRLSREAPGVLMLDYGKAGRFRLEVTSADTSRTLADALMTDLLIRTLVLSLCLTLSVDVWPQLSSSARR